MITPQNIIQHELVGLDATVVHSTNSDMIGISGSVIYETRNTITLDTISGHKCIPKSICDLELSNDTMRVIINGTKIQKRPFDRIGTR